MNLFTFALTFYALNSAGEIFEKRIRCFHNEKDLNEKIRQISKDCTRSEIKSNQCKQYTGRKIESFDKSSVCKSSVTAISSIDFTK